MGSAPKVGITISLGQSGWGNCHLQVGDKTYQIDHVSYSTDMLGDLARTALSAAVGELRSACRFDHEPGETRLLAEREWSAEMNLIFRVRVLELKNIYANASDSTGDERFCAECDPDDFAHAVLDAVHEIRPERYKKWDHPYPHRVLSALKAALSVSPD